MSFQPGANLYTQGFGSRVENVEVPHLEVRDPTSTDVLYPIGKIWINTLLNTLFFLPNLSTSNGITTANWTKLEDANGALNTLSDGTTKISPDGTGNISILGTPNQTTVTSNAGSHNLATGLSSSIITPGSLQVTGAFKADSGSIISGGAVDIETGTSALTLNTSSTGNISIGQTTGSQITQILAGSGGVKIDSVGGSQIHIANTLFNTSEVHIGNSNTPTVEIAGQNISAFTYGPGININSLGGGQVNINTSTAANTTIGLSGAGSHNTSIYAGNSGIINIGNVGNESVQIGNTSGIGSTSIDGGTSGVYILNVAGNSNTLAVGPYLPNGTSGNIEFNPGDSGGRILLNGGQSVLVSGTASGPGSANLSVSKYFIPCDTTSGALTIVLPASPGTGQHYVISDISGTAIANNITIDGNGHNINGSSTLVLSQAYARADIYYTGSVWSR